MKEIKVAVETVLKEKLDGEKVVIYNSLHERTSQIEVTAQGVDRSFEDRDVYFSIDAESSSIKGLGLAQGHNIYTEWLRAEQAIELGQALIRQGNLAFKENMLNHQLFRMKEALKEFISDGIVEYVRLTVVDENPVNYGSGSRKYLVEPIWIDGKEPEFREDFCFEQVIYFSPFDSEFKEQLEQFGEVQFVGYDRESEVRKFEEAVLKGGY